MTPLELLAPARDADIAIQAILHGADAVYMGGPSFGARAAAANSIDDLSRAISFAHRYGARVYVALNTIIFDSELPQAEALVRECWRIGADALIVQDMSLLRMRIPPIALHASTQCDIRTPDKARFLAECGFSQLVLPREFTLDEIRAVRRAVPAGVSLEAFVHGALCVSYSGDCQASCLANGRSANRGECAQMCRMAYDLEDGHGRKLVSGKHLLSLRDLNRLADLEDMALAGVSSFKIEGRLKDASYVKTVVGAYRRAIDSVIEAHPGLFCRSSYGTSALGFEPDVGKVFNRGFTSYFLSEPRKARSMASVDTPKWIGEPVGSVVSCRGRRIRARLDAPLGNGDGLGYFAPDGSYAGFRVNRVQDGEIFAASDVRIAPGTRLYRNRDAALDAAMQRPTASRRIAVDLTLQKVKGGVSLRAEAEGGRMACARADCEVAPALTGQAAQRLNALRKLGDTIFEARQVDDRLDPGDFVPASVLAGLRRRVASLLESDIIATHAYDYRRSENKEARCPDARLTYHNNVANALAEKFYAEHGAATAERALECASPEARMSEPRTAMTTRYCLRRELGACLRTPAGSKLPPELYLRNRAASYRLCFDCADCRMRLITCP